MWQKVGLYRQPSWTTSWSVWSKQGMLGMHCSLNQQQSCCRCHTHQHVGHQKCPKPVDSWWVWKHAIWSPVWLSSNETAWRQTCTLSNSAVTKWLVRLWYKSASYESWTKDDHKSVVILTWLHFSMIVSNFLLTFSYISGIKVSEKYLSDGRVYLGSTVAIRCTKPILLTMLNASLSTAISSPIIWVSCLALG